MRSWVHTGEEETFKELHFHHIRLQTVSHPYLGGGPRLVLRTAVHRDRFVHVLVHLRRNEARQVGVIMFHVAGKKENWKSPPPRLSFKPFITVK